MVPITVIFITLVSISLWQLRQFISFEYLEIQETSRSYLKNDNAAIVQEKERLFGNISIQSGLEEKELLASEIHSGTDLEDPFRSDIINNNNMIPDDDMSFESVKSLLTMGIEDDFPELHLSENEFQDLTQAVISIRESMQELRRLDRTGKNAQFVTQIQDRLNEASIDFEQISGMSLTNFIRRASVVGGIDNDRPDDKDINFEYLDDNRR